MDHGAVDDEADQHRDVGLADLVHGAERAADGDIAPLTGDDAAQDVATGSAGRAFEVAPPWCQTHDALPSTPLREVRLT